MAQFEEIQAFIHIVEHGSMTAAAERLGLAKSAISRRLAELEERLGVELFHRTTRRMTLTDSGQSFYERAVRIMADLEEAENAVSQAHQELRGELRIAAPLSFGVMHLGPAIADFQQLHPAIRFDIDFNDRQVDLIREGYDLGIRIANLKDSSLIARKFATMTSVVCASPAYLATSGTPSTLEELSHHTCLTYSYLPAPNQWNFIDQSGQEQIIKVGGGLQSNNGDFLRQAAVAGLGIVRQPTFIAYQSIQRNELVPILQDYAIPNINAHIIYPPTRHLSQRVRAFIDFLVDRFAGIPYWEHCLK
ncbi:MAG: LysR family transcriptional regulator [Thioalkalispiraceae bacterium]|jgi:DNA-binding transcriptional LysR family regulator